MASPPRESEPTAVRMTTPKELVRFDGSLTKILANRRGKRELGRTTAEG